MLESSKRQEEQDTTTGGGRERGSLVVPPSLFGRVVQLQAAQVGGRERGGLKMLQIAKEGRSLLGWCLAAAPRNEGKAEDDEGDEEERHGERALLIEAGDLRVDVVMMVTSCSTPRCSPVHSPRGLADITS